MDSDGDPLGNRRAVRLALVGLCAVYLLLSFYKLGQTPTIHNDEIGILEPGLTLWQRGQLASPMYSGFHGQETVYLEVMPLMPALQGLTATLFGVSVAAMRLVPVLAGLLILLATYRMAIQISSREIVGLLAAALLLVWQLHPPAENDFLQSGVTLLDVSRLARYDGLAAALGLMAWSSWLNALRSARKPDYAICGVWVGLAVLTHLYTLVWPLAMGLHALFYHRPARSGDANKGLPIVYAAALAVCLPWLIVIGQNWASFLGQLSKHETKTAFLSLAFYANNALTEIQRYHLGLRIPTTYLRVGFWIFSLGFPAALVTLVRRVGRKSDRDWLALLIPMISIPALFGLMLAEKRPYYLISILPIFSISVALIAISYWQRGPRLVRLLLAAVAVTAVLQSGQGVFHSYRRTQTQKSPQAFFSELRAALPEATRIVAPQTYWPGLQGYDFRALLLPGLLAESQPDSFSSPVAALDSLTPNVLILHPPGLMWFDEYQSELEDFFANHSAQLAAQLTDFDGETVLVYQLVPAER